MAWEHFPHGADIGVRGIGATCEEAFEQAALALTAAVTDPSGVRERTAVHVEREAADQELLLVDWLNALIYDMATQKLVFARSSVRIDDGRLVASAWGERLDRARHRPAVEPKAATYSELSVRRRDDGTWVAQCVVDV
jgi:tRNA nucleotidyltransferase (CCA-adding enzyme)